MLGEKQMMEVSDVWEVWQEVPVKMFDEKLTLVRIEFRTENEGTGLG